MRRRIALSLGVGALVVALLAAPASAQRQPYQTNDYLGFRSVLPPGTKGVFNATELTPFLANGTTRRTRSDQLGMYRDLIYAAPGLAAADIPKYFKDASFGVPAGQEERTYSPRAGVIDRPRQGLRRAARLRRHARRHDVRRRLRRAPRTGSSSWTCCATPAAAQLSGFAGGANKAMDRDVWSSLALHEADLQKQIDQLDNLSAPRAPRCSRTSTTTSRASTSTSPRRGSTRARCRPSTRRSARPLDDWKATDIVATAALVGGIFGKGGGSEVESIDALDAARRRFGAFAGTQVWDDFRRQTTPRRRPRCAARLPLRARPRQRPGRASPSPTRGSLVDPPPARPPHAGARRSPRA